MGYPYDHFEIKIASLMIAGFELLWATLAVAPGPSVFYDTLATLQIGEHAFIALFGVGGLLAFGAIRPHRRARHIGLVLSVLVWFALFFAFALEALITPATLSMPILALAALYLLARDARCKARSLPVEPPRPSDAIR